MATRDRGTRIRPIIRVFISSTFNDFKRERDALQEWVFPRLEQLCANEGFQFQAIDLRWGVPTEAGLHHRTMQICFEELRRSQEISPEPNFLILLGDRYGWRPLPEAISQSEFDKLVTAARTAGKDGQPIEGAHGKSAEKILSEWYLRDYNMLVPDPREVHPDRATLNYILRPRTLSLGDNRDYTRTDEEWPRDTKDWMDVQDVLWRIINATFPVINHDSPEDEFDQRFQHTSWTRRLAEADGDLHPRRAVPQIVRFQGSATEQEIWAGALSVRNAERHVLAFTRSITNRNEFDPREIESFFNLTQDKEFDDEAAQAQNALKIAIEERLGTDAVVPMPFSRLTKENGKVVIQATDDEILAFRKAVESRLTAIINRQIEQYWRPQTAVSPDGGLSADQHALRQLEIERDEHLRFCIERGSKATFIGRQDHLNRIQSYLQGESRYPLVIYGSSGCGKSALLARAFQDIAVPHTPIIRFIGVTPQSSDIGPLLHSVCQELRQRFPMNETIPSDPHELAQEFLLHLKSATADKPIIVFLDALDQLSELDNGRSLFWIPFGELPPHVKLVVSCLANRDESDPVGQPYQAILRRKLPAENMLSLDALSPQEAETLLFDHWLHASGRTVSDLKTQQLKQLLSGPDCRQPLFLKLLFEEARRWRSWEEPPPPGHNVSELLEQLCKRLSEPENHGESLVRLVLGYLSAARAGLGELEILEVLFANSDFKRELDLASQRNQHTLPDNPPRIPMAIWSRLRSDLEPYLAERMAVGGAVLTMYHRQIAEWVSARYVDGATWEPHKRLATYFVGKAKGVEPGKEWETDSVRGFAECVFHLSQSGQHELAIALLQDVGFLIHKLRVGLLEGVLADYDLVLRDVLPGAANKLDTWDNFFREKAHILRRGLNDGSTHKIFLQLAVEHADDSPLTQAAEAWQNDGRCDWLRWQRVNRPVHLSKSACLSVLEGHTAGVRGALLLPNGRLISWSDDATLREWDSETGVCLSVLEGHWQGIKGALPLTHGRLLSWSEDTTLRIWDSATGACLSVLEGHWNEIMGALPLPDGHILSWTKGGDLWKWDSETGTCQLRHQYHIHWAGIYGAMSGIFGARQHEICVIVFWSDDGTLRVWDSKTRACRSVLEGHTSVVEGALFLPGISRLLSWSWDGTLRVWDSRSGACLNVLEGHTSQVNGALPLPDRRLLSWSLDHTLRMWDSATGTCIRVLNGHTNGISGALLLTDGRLLSWSSDRTLRVWDSATGDCLHVLEGHENAVSGALPLDDGRLLSWSSDGTLRVWDSETGVCLSVLQGHAAPVEGVLPLDDGRLLSWSSDGTLRIWDSATCACRSFLEGHLGWVNRALPLPDGQLISWAAEPDGQLISWRADTTLRVWDSATGACLKVLEGHTHRVTAALPLPDGRLFSWSLDDTLRVWDIATGACQSILEGQNSLVIGALRLADGRLLSWSQYLLQVWDSATGACLSVLDGHMSTVRGALPLADGQILSWSNDRTLRVWDIATSACLSVLEGHKSNVTGALLLSDGRLLSWSQDDTLRMWDIATGTCQNVLKGHTDDVNGALSLSDGRLLSWSKDGMLRVWDSATAACLVVLSEKEATTRHPEWLYARAAATQPQNVAGDFFAESQEWTTLLRHKALPAAIAIWNADSASKAHCLFADGTLVVGQRNGQVCILKLHHGQRRISLAEAVSLIGASDTPSSTPFAE